ncbi:MAG: undecaprenyldiphospho-muramoylpentapeptide beta-N-acetylglucosaminyltransferase [Gammaproteobacteria bacterium]|nr:undecaprenyldiphospho-muramoylpentapeptide beta-N-acetylglucosaminyltransferase [Gammaproteobacteria bacterium]MDH5651520.1 undecaprenyldiphospho-muramoylpentapeptide beta-N-acetylglucosaminyltransferase [Gammaproteobacteria bacterium]
MSQHILIMAGGTGGHVFPALAIARYMLEKGVAVTWLGTQAGLEARVVPEAGIPICYISVKGLRGKGLAGWLLAPFKLVYALTQAVGVVRKVKPNVVLGLGGFVTGPGGMAAWLMRKPLVIHEQNAIPGMTNRLLSRFAKRVLEAFPGSFPASAKLLHTGNPVRKEISALSEPVARMAQHQDRLRLLVIGGSLGAQALNETLPGALAMLDEAQRPEVWHQTGANKSEATQAMYDELKIAARVAPFINDMAEAYGWADLVICRAGALTLSELCAAGVGSILVPYPHAVDDHQTWNARSLVNEAAAILLPQHELTIEKLAGLLQSLLQKDRQQLLQMAQAARRLARPQATEQVAAICLEAANG